MSCGRAGEFSRFDLASETTRVCEFSFAELVWTSCDDGLCPVETHEEGLCGVVISAIAFAWMGPLGSADRHLTEDATRPAYWGLGGLGVVLGGVLQLPGVLGQGLGHEMRMKTRRTEPSRVAGSGECGGRSGQSNAVGGGVSDLRCCRLRCL
jgi:hypothetical protein